jgi:cyclopropane-fatty-acyl-phospholipid synthase
VGTVTIEVRSALYELLVDPELGFGDGYTDGRIRVHGELRDIIEALARRTSRTDGHRWLADVVSPLVDRWRANTPSAARRDIHRHYDIGTDFYRLWLDAELLYTCAYVEDPDCTLEHAQLAKMDHVCRKLRLRPGDRVVEAGCGWGAFALHMARHYGARVTAYNISSDQVAYARQRARQEGLSDRVEFIEDDYRNIRGTFDVFVSVGMLEHVGLAHYRGFGTVIDRCLSDSGRGFVHFIGRNRPQGVSLWTKKRIFPGTFAPTLPQAMTVFEEHDFSVLDVENLRLHYAWTVEHWLARYEASEERVIAMFGPEFARAWRLYLTSSIVAFRLGSLQLFQLVFARGRDNDVPWTRAHLYGASAKAQEDRWTASTP